jgi:uncharacterized peroxidase-related enzyme
MSWIQIVNEANSTGNLKRIYNEIRRKRDKISNIMKVQSLNPDAMAKHMDLYLTLMFGSSGLTREVREFIAVVVSSVNRCEYCINHHVEALNHYWKDNEKIQRLIDDFRSVDLSEKLQRMADYVIKLTKIPYEVKKDDIDALRKSGFTDEDILNINLIACYFNFVNRISLGLGIEFSSEEVKGYKY